MRESLTTAPTVTVKRDSVSNTPNRRAHFGARRHKAAKVLLSIYTVQALIRAFRSANWQPESTGKKWAITNSINVHRLRERLSANLVLHPLSEAAAMYSGLSSLLKSLSIGPLQRLQQTGQSAVHSYP